MARRKDKETMLAEELMGRWRYALNTQREALTELRRLVERKRELCGRIIGSAQTDGLGIMTNAASDSVAELAVVLADECDSRIEVIISELTSTLTFRRYAEEILADARLTEREKRTVIAYYIKKEPLYRVAERFELSERTVQRLRSEGMRKLGKHLAALSPCEAVI